MFKTAFDVMLGAVSPWQSLVDDATAERFEAVRLHPNLDFMEASERNPLACVALLILDEKLGCTPDDDTLSRIARVDPAYLEAGASWDAMPEAVRFEALGRLTERMLRCWRNQVREAVLIPTLGCCDPFEQVTE